MTARRLNGYYAVDRGRRQGVKKVSAQWMEEHMGPMSPKCEHAGYVAVGSRRKWVWWGCRSE